ncbi:cation:proton antiporter [Halomonas sp. M4R1S46]|uniref:cation:proton antiporter n=1 Tax=Halomonas sp. M4R1S46 TaxID=2982692 RepID=UPI0021E49E66|nr:sodium:proton antiporter [Halomonas sp. M4R1S46]UYG08619.1 cation:proton antiporter [Halomonas sp. M4R1S46]
MEHAGLDLAAIGLLALICQWLAWQLKLPAILMLLVAGIAAGPVTGLLDPDALFGDLLFPLVSLAVAVILFEGSLTLNFRELGGHGQTVRRLVTGGALITGVIATVSAHYLLALSWEMASVLGALLVVTGPTVILPMLQTLRAREHLTQILRWEGILIDPVGAIGAVLVYEFVALGSGSEAATQTLLLFGKTALIGFGLGIAGGHLWGQVLRRYWLPRQLHSFGTLMMMLALFSLSNLLFHESGLLTVTVMGAWLANMRGVPTRPIIEFKETLSVLLISGLFILLAARLTVEQLALLGWPAWAFLAVLVGVARPLAVWLCTLGSRLELREKALLAFISPRGIVAAATASLFALRLEEIGVAGAEMLVPVTFLVIISTVVSQSLLSRPLAHWLGVQRPSPDGVLIIGANQVAREVGCQLQAAGVSVVLADSSWDAIQLAQRAGLTTYYGDPLSEHAAQHLELSGIGYLLPLSPYRELNDLAALHFEHLLGRDRVFRLAVDEGRRANRPHGQALDHLPLLFGRDVTFAKLSRLVAEGGEVQRLRFSEKTRLEEQRNAHGNRWLPLLCIGPSGRVRLATAEGGLTPRRGDTLVSLIFADSPARQAPPAS